MQEDNDKYIVKINRKVICIHQNGESSKNIWKLIWWPQKFWSDEGLKQGGKMEIWNSQIYK